MKFCEPGRLYDFIDISTASAVSTSGSTVARSRTMAEKRATVSASRKNGSTARPRRGLSPSPHPQASRSLRGSTRTKRLPFGIIRRSDATSAHVCVERNRPRPAWRSALPFRSRSTSTRSTPETTEALAKGTSFEISVKPKGCGAMADIDAADAVSRARRSVADARLSLAGKPARSALNA